MTLVDIRAATAAFLTSLMVTRKVAPKLVQVPPTIVFIPTSDVTSEPEDLTEKTLESGQVEKIVESILSQKGESLTDHERGELLTTLLRWQDLRLKVERYRRMLGNIERVWQEGRLSNSKYRFLRKRYEHKIDRTDEELANLASWRHVES